MSYVFFAVGVPISKENVIHITFPLKNLRFFQWWIYQNIKVIKKKFWYEYMKNNHRNHLLYIYVYIFYVYDFIISITIVICKSHVLYYDYYIVQK